MPVSKKSITLLNGHFESEVFDELKDQKIKNVFVMEGRPTLKASQKSCKALLKNKIKPTLISDNMAGFLFASELVKEVWCAYYDVNEKGAVVDVGGIILGVLAKAHNVPVFLYPSDEKMKVKGASKDLTSFLGKSVAPKGTKTYVPLVEFMPHKYISEYYSKETHDHEGCCGCEDENCGSG